MTTAEETKPRAAYTKMVTMASSNPTSPGYLVRINVEAVSCQCKGFAFRQTCRHLTEALSQFVITDLV